MRPEASIVMSMTLTVAVGEMQRRGTVLVRVARPISQADHASLAHEILNAYPEIVDWESDHPEGPAKLRSFTINRLSGEPDSSLIIEFDRDSDGMWVIGV